MQLTLANSQVHVHELPLRKVAIMGTQASFHHRAAQLMLGDTVALLPCAGFAEEVAAVLSGDADAAVMAVENTIVGLMLPNLHQIVHNELRILGELYHPIALQLLAKPGTSLGEINTVYSHPYALQQCAPFLAQFPHLQRVESSDTASAARLVQESEAMDVAAVASNFVGAYYGLDTLATDIHTQQANFTRFMLLARAGTVLQPTKATFWFMLKHAPGALAAVLHTFAQHALNLTKITSIALPQHPNAFAFLVEFVFDDHQQYAAALAAIGPQVQALQVLGEYAQAFFTPYQG